MQDMNPRDRIAWRVARELRDGDVVNLGIGLPTMVADHVPPGVSVHLHTENGLLGVGPTPAPEQVDVNLVNAGKQPVTALPGCAYFSSADSFAMIRGGHVDIAVLGVLQCDAGGLVANWALPRKAVLGVGGAMDLLIGARYVVVATPHVNSDGEPKLVAELSFPLTALRPVDAVVTDLAAFRLDAGGLVLAELAPGVTLDQVRGQTGAPFRVAEPLPGFGAAALLVR